jgi:hypothetical protein
MAARGVSRADHLRGSQNRYAAHGRVPVTRVGSPAKSADLVRNDSRLPLIRRMRTWLSILGTSRSRSSHEWAAGKGSDVAERNVRHIAGFTF